MKLLRFIRPMLAIAALLVGIAAMSAAPAGWESADIQITVAGTSTLHDWKVGSRTALGSLRVTSEGVAVGALTIPARSLSGGPAGLNDKMYGALHATKYPTIAFEALDLRLPAEMPATGAVQEWPVRGKLTLAGTTREILVPCRVAVSDAGGLVIETELGLKMTDFAIKPPTFMGVVRTGDAVTVQVRWTLRPMAPTPKA
jgi:polyisoprenoid-binding protein YceI